jgi:2-amino-4-hydroxy-6-hydroxymethyldihydropteridine diphosphokinase
MSQARARAFVALGSNLEDPQAQVRAALLKLDQLPSTRLVRTSCLYLTPPWGITDQPDFVNAVAELETALTPIDLLGELQRIERETGRVRGQRFGPRVLDLDLLWQAGAQLEHSDLTLPHPRMHERAFVMLPLAEIAPELGLAGGAAAELAAKLDAAGIRRLPAS